MVLKVKVYAPSVGEERPRCFSFQVKAHVIQR